MYQRKALLQLPRQVILCGFLLAVAQLYLFIDLLVYRIL